MAGAMGGGMVPAGRLVLRLIWRHKSSSLVVDMLVFWAVFFMLGMTEWLGRRSVKESQWYHFALRNKAAGIWGCALAKRQ